MLLPLIPSPLYLKGFLHLLKCSFKIAKYCSGSGTNNSPYSFLSHFSSDCITLLFFYLLCGLKYFFSAMSIYKNVLKSLYFFSFLCHIDCPYQFFLCLYISFLATTFHQFLPTLTFSFQYLANIIIPPPCCLFLGAFLLPQLLSARLKLFFIDLHRFSMWPTTLACVAFSNSTPKFSFIKPVYSFFSQFPKLIP